YVKAPEVTRQRLFIEAQEQILSDVSKVVVDQKEGSNSLLYLPLDKLMQISGQTVNRNTSQSSVSDASDTMVQSASDSRSLQRSRERVGN
ncbi:MAG TPA: protease modulator HflK, partial [Methylophilaceae bacterium]|nr:protease modulator HflK [Methylophilaceae bacterium]